MPVEEYSFEGVCLLDNRKKLICVEVSGGKLQVTDCLYETCMRKARCEIGRKLEDMQKKAAAG